MNAPSASALGLCFAFPPGLRAFEMSSPPRFRQNASLLHFTFEAFEYILKRITRTH